MLVLSEFMVFFLITPLILFEIYEIWLNFKMQNQELHIRETFHKLNHFFIFGLSSCSDYMYQVI
jgi:hypothetical protein